VTRVAVGCGLVAALIATSCVHVTHLGGLLVVMSTDGTVSPDALRIDITSTDGTKSYRSATYEIPSEATLPTSIAIASNGDPTASVSIRVSVSARGIPLDVREDHVFQIPSDRVAELDIVFSATCTSQATLVNGTPASRCPTEQTCDPTSGSCVSDIVTLGGDGGSPESGLLGNQEASTDAPTPECVPAMTHCLENAVQTCGADGQWRSEAVDCPAQTPVCNGGTCGQPASCQSSVPGTSDCGPDEESCCASLDVAPGSYFRAYTNLGGGPTDEAHPASVSRFKLDKYDVTVGRFRRFVSAWNGGWAPAAGSGKHTHLNGGAGLTGVGGASAYEPGWGVSDDAYVMPTDANLACGGAFATWTPAPGTGETRPINCVNWWESYAFCIWDGGFLPSEAEAGYAAAGGSEQREYPWGMTDPGTMSQYAIYGCDYPSGSGTCTDVSNIAPVGTAPRGAGLWGQLDLAGNLWPWALDWHADYVDPCVDCTAVNMTTSRAHGGADFHDPVSYLAAGSPRHANPPQYRDPVLGVRCAREP
jgi:sulfatase modifying factor 1